MAVPEHVEIVKGGWESVRKWRATHADVRLDLTGAPLSYANLAGVVLDGADLRRAELTGSNFTEASLRKTNLSHATLDHADLSDVDLTDADLRHASLRGTAMLHTCLDGANLTGARIFGLAVWDVSLTGTIQNDLTITPWDPDITTDTIEMAQFAYLVLQNRGMRCLVDSMTAKSVLILGRFGTHLETLAAIRNRLRALGYVPVLFDFDKPAHRDITETVMILAGLARFIVADLTDPASIPKELEAVIPKVSVPVRPIIEGHQRPYSMFDDYWKYPWVIREPFRYDNRDDLLKRFESEVVDVAEAKVAEIAQMRPAT